MTRYGYDHRQPWWDRWWIALILCGLVFGLGVGMIFWAIWQMIPQ